MSNRVVLLFDQQDKYWVRDFPEWSLPIPRQEEAFILGGEDWVDILGLGPAAEVDRINWMLWGTTPFAIVALDLRRSISRDEEAVVQWMLERGFHKLESAQQVQDFFGIEGMADVLKDYDQAPDDTAPPPAS